jgi:hypothetical protein
MHKCTYVSVKNHSFLDPFPVCKTKQIITKQNKPASWRKKEFDV